MNEFRKGTIVASQIWLIRWGTGRVCETDLSNERAKLLRAFVSYWKIFLIYGVWVISDFWAGIRSSTLHSQESFWARKLQYSIPILTCYPEQTNLLSKNVKPIVFIFFAVRFSPKLWCLNDAFRHYRHQGSSMTSCAKNQSKSFCDGFAVCMLVQSSSGKIEMFVMRGVFATSSTYQPRFQVCRARLIISFPLQQLRNSRRCHLISVTIFHHTHSAQIIPQTLDRVCIEPLFIIVQPK